MKNAPVNPCSDWFVKAFVSNVAACQFEQFWREVDEGDAVVHRDHVAGVQLARSMT